MDSFEANLIPNLESVGIHLTMEPVAMEELLERYYKKDDRDMDMIYLASNFDVVFDPSVNFIVDSNGEPNWSYTNEADEVLYRLAVDMRATEPGDTMTYCQKWITFQERFNDVLPMLPIYSNIYFDFYNSFLRNYLIGENVTWTQAIIAAYQSDEPEVEEEEELAEGEMVFEN